MQAAEVIEDRRLELQAKLDSQKTPSERNKLGQFATPTLLAQEMLSYARLLLTPGAPVRFLDPAFGTGSFYSALLQVFADWDISVAVGYEIDLHYAERVVEFWQGTPLDLRVADFTRAQALLSDEERFNLLICNPPYVRHHHLTEAEKQRLQGETREAAGVWLSGLAGLYCHFLIRSHEWMADGGVAGWLIPSEFMNVNYGKEVKRYLLEQVTLLHIHRFDPQDAQFDDALVSSAVVWFKKSLPSADHQVTFSYGGTVSKPRVIRTIPAEVLRNTPKWTKFPAGYNGQIVLLTQNSKLSDLFWIKRGLATGANEFFILTSAQVIEQQLPNEFLIPILPSARYLNVEEIQADETGNPVLDKRLFLLSCDLSEQVVMQRYPALWKYLQTGIKAGINKRYLCQHRTIWYRQEDRPPAPFLCTYMGRQRATGNPFRFILNHSEATAANTYLMLYPKPPLAQLLRDNLEFARFIWQALRDIPPQTLVDEGRVYGGGLHKLEPKELSNAPADSIMALLR